MQSNCWSMVNKWHTIGTWRYMDQGEGICVCMIFFFKWDKICEAWELYNCIWSSLSQNLTRCCTLLRATESPNIAKSEQSCIRDINFASFYDFPVWILQLSDSVVIFVFLFNFYLKYLFVLLCDIVKHLVSFNFFYGTFVLYKLLFFSCFVKKN
jgi:hypothetical protein